MSDTKQIASDLQQLSEAQANEVIALIEKLKKQSPEPKRGSVEAAMRGFGAWKDTMAPDEIESLLRDIAEQNEVVIPERDLPPRL